MGGEESAQLGRFKCLVSGKYNLSGINVQMQLCGKTLIFEYDLTTVYMSAHKDSNCDVLRLNAVLLKDGS